MPRAKKFKDDEPSTLAPTVIETMRATAEVRSTKAMPRVKGSTGDESSTLTPTVTNDARDGQGKRHQGNAEGEKSKDDEPSTLTPTVSETMHATGEVRGTKAMPRVKESTDSRVPSRRCSRIDTRLPSRK